MLKKMVFPHMSKQMNKMKLQRKRGRKSKNKGSEDTYQEFRRVLFRSIIGEEDIFIPIDIEDKIITEIAEPEFDLQLESQKGEMGEEKESRWTPDEGFRLLQVYFREMGTEPLLTPKEEVEVSAKIKKCEARAREVKKILEKILDKKLGDCLEDLVTELEGITNRNIQSGVSLFNRKTLSRRTNSKLRITPKRVKRFSVLTRAYLNRARGFKERFVKANLRLVVSIAKRYMARGLPPPDLIQAGNVGLMRGGERLDPT